MKDRGKEHFGWAVDAINAAMKGLLVYCVLLLAGFKLYQGGKGAFQPFLYALVVPLFMGCAWCYARLEGRTFVLSHIGLLGVWMLPACFVKGNGVLFCLAGLLAAGSSAVSKLYFKDTDKRRHARRFKSLNYFRWGAGIFACSLFLYGMADPVTDAFPISVKTCSRYMTAAFGMYLVLVVMLEYAYQQYDYDRNHAGVDKNTYFHLKRMNVIVTVITAVLIFFVVVFTKETLAVWLTKGYVKILEYLVAAGFMGLSRLQAVYEPEGAQADPGGLSKLKHKIKAAPDSKFPVSAVVTVLLVLAALYLLWRLYTKLGANYRAGGDEAQYISRRQETGFEVTAIREEREHIRFGNGNRAKIRKLYYKLMNRRMRKEEMEQVKGKTPEELANMYARAGEQERFEEMRVYYEKARYAKEACTDGEVEAARKLAEGAKTGPGEKG